MSASVALPPLEDVLQLTDINIIQRLLQVCFCSHHIDNALQVLIVLQDAITLETQLTSQLDVLLTKTESIDAKLDFIDIVPCAAFLMRSCTLLIIFFFLIRSKLKPITKEARDLHATISRTCGLADTVSKKVRDLDTTRERVRTTIKKVEDIVDVRSCIDGVGKALAQERYEEAAGTLTLWWWMTVSIELFLSLSRLRCEISWNCSHIGGAHRPSIDHSTERGSKET